MSEQVAGLTIGSEFSGTRGLDMAIEALFGARTIWVSDIKPAAVKLLAHYWPEIPNLGDITAIDWSAVERPQIVTGGFPCTDVSQSGGQAGLISTGENKTRSGLWGEMLYSIASLRPDLVVAENVRGLLSARGAEPTDELEAAWSEIARIETLLEGNENDPQGSTLEAARLLGLRKSAVAAAKRADKRIIRAIGTVLGTLADIGYSAAWHGIRAADAGAPHGRFRIFICAWPAADAGGEEQSRRAGLRAADPEWLGWARSGDGDFAAAYADSSRQLQQRRAIAGAAEVAGAGRDGRSCEQVGQAVERAAVAGSGESGDGGIDWGKYAGAIERWGTVLGRPAPAPTVTGPQGGQQLSPYFDEWLMGLPQGHVTGVPGLTRSEMLSLCGDGVVPQQAFLALSELAERVALALDIERSA